MSFTSDFCFRVLAIPLRIRRTKAWGSRVVSCPTYCSICRRRITRGLIITKGSEEQWHGICVPCVKAMADAVEES